MMKTFKDHLHLPVTMVDDTATMMETLKVWKRHSDTSHLSASGTCGIAGNVLLVS